MLVAGGARGITAAVAETLSPSDRAPTLLLIGSSPSPSKRGEPRTSGLTTPPELKKPRPPRASSAARDVGVRPSGPSGSLKMSVLDLLMNEKKLKPVFLNLDIGEQITLKFKLFDKEVEGELSRESDDVFSLKAKLKGFNFYPVGSMFILGLDEFKTSIDGDVSFRFSPSTGIKSAVIDLSSFELNGGAFHLKSKGNMYVSYAGGSYSIRPFTLISDSETLKCSMNFNNEGKG